MANQNVVHRSKRPHLLLICGESHHALFQVGKADVFLIRHLLTLFLFSRVARFVLIIGSKDEMCKIRMSRLIPQPYLRHLVQHILQSRLFHHHQPIEHGTPNGSRLMRFKCLPADGRKENLKEFGLSPQLSFIKRNPLQRHRVAHRILGYRQRPVQKAADRQALIHQITAQLAEAAVRIQRLSNLREAQSVGVFLNISTSFEIWMYSKQHKLTRLNKIVFGRYPHLFFISTNGCAKI